MPIIGCEDLNSRETQSNLEPLKKFAEGEGSPKRGAHHQSLDHRHGWVPGGQPQEPSKRVSSQIQQDLSTGISSNMVTPEEREADFTTSQLAQMQAYRIQWFPVEAVGAERYGAASSKTARS